MRALSEIVKEIRVINNAAARDTPNVWIAWGKITERFVADPNGYPAVGTFLAHSVG